MKIKLKKKQVRKLLRESFPDYKGRKFYLEFKDRITVYNLNWSGGSKNEYAFFRADNKKAFVPARPPWDNPFERQAFDLSPEVLVVEHCIFCGRDMGITVYAHPKLAARILPEFTGGEL